MALTSQTEWPLVSKVKTRKPSVIMHPEGLSAMKPYQLSFCRSFIRHMTHQRWRIENVHFDLDDEGMGTVVYRIITKEIPINFVVFSYKIPEEKKTERVIAKKWDGVAFLSTGELSDLRLEKARNELHDVMTGRADLETIAWTRANRSSRFFDHVVESLSNGNQPNVDLLAQGGYLFRNSGYYGNGRHGTKLFDSFSPDHPLSKPYHGEMLALYMWRHFSFDLADHIAQRRSRKAVKLDPNIKRYLGIGNSSGVGLIPFIINHPKRLHTWVLMRESCLAYAKSKHPTLPEFNRLVQLLDRCIRYFNEDQNKDKGVFTPSDLIARDLSLIKDKVRVGIDNYNNKGLDEGDETFWEVLCEWAASDLNNESCEVLNSLLIEIYPEVIDRLEPFYYVPEESNVIPDMNLNELLSIIKSNYDWALQIDKGTKAANKYFWYLSADNREPRIGQRGEEIDEEYVQYVDITNSVQNVFKDLLHWTGGKSVAEFLMQFPHYRFIIERIQFLQSHPYAEVRGNLTGEDFVPAHLIRFILSLFGMEKFDPISNRWVQGTLLQGAPLADEVALGIEGDWIYPTKPILKEC